MSYFVGGAIIASTAVGAISSRKASKDQAKGIQRGLDQSSALAQQAREDVLGLFDRSARSARLGSKGAFEFYKRVAPQRIAPYLQGNEQARQAITIGAQQANNAILGQPVDMEAINQPGVQPDLSYMEDAEIPDYQSANIQAETANQPEQVAQPNVNPGMYSGIMGGADPMDRAKLEASLRFRPGGRL